MITVTVERPAPPDELGDATGQIIKRWEIAGVLLAPVVEDEDARPGRSAWPQRYNLYARGQTDLGIEHGDMITAYGRRYRVDGHPQVWDSGRRPSGTVVRLRRVDG